MTVSGLEISRSRYGQFTDREQVDRRLRAVTAAIHGRVNRENGDGPIDDHRCADVAADRTLAEAIATRGTV